MRVLEKLSLLFNTVKYLKASQIYHRVWFKLYRPEPNFAPAPEHQSSENWTIPVLKPRSFWPDMTFTFLNQTGTVTDISDWNSSDHEKLWLYNLHYFDDLQALDHATRRNEQEKLILRWIEENPAAVGNGWEPYPLSLRIVNWIKWVLSGGNLTEDMAASLAVQVRFLSQRCEYHLLGNHLYVNGKALLFAGMFFQGDEARAWLRKGEKIIFRETQEQVLDDGGNFELSPMYHAIFLEDVLDMINLYAAYTPSPPEILSKLVKPMLDWLEAMSHPDGQVSFFNDSAIGVAACVNDLRSYASRLGFEVQSQPLERLSIFEQSGYIRIHWEDMDLILDVAPVGPDYIPGHAHADTLSFELSLFGQRCIVNSGTSVYGIGKERLRQRGTEAHNTLVLDGEDSSEVWGGFRVARRAKIKNLKIVQNQDQICIQGEHTGYRRLPGSPVHRREWDISRNEILIWDSVISSKAHDARINFHLHPDCAGLHQGYRVEVDCCGHPVTIEGNGMGEMICEESTYHPEFNVVQESRKITCSLKDVKAERILTKISW